MAIHFLGGMAEGLDKAAPYLWGMIGDDRRNKAQMELEKWKDLRAGEAREDQQAHEKELQTQSETAAAEAAKLKRQQELADAETLREQQVADAEKKATADLVAADLADQRQRRRDANKEVGEIRAEQRKQGIDLSPIKLPDPAEFFDKHKTHENEDGETITRTEDELMRMLEDREASIIAQWERRALADAASGGTSPQVARSAVDQLLDVYYRYMVEAPQAYLARIGGQPSQPAPQPRRSTDEDLERMMGLRQSGGPSAPMMRGERLL